MITFSRCFLECLRNELLHHHHLSLRIAVHPVEHPLHVVFEDAEGHGPPLGIQLLPEDVLELLADRALVRLLLPEVEQGDLQAKGPFGIL